MKTEITVALIKEESKRRPRFTTPVFNKPEERIGEETREFDIKGDYNG